MTMKKFTPCGDQYKPVIARVEFDYCHWQFKTETQTDINANKIGRANT